MNTTGYRQRVAATCGVAMLGATLAACGSTATTHSATAQSSGSSGAVSASNVAYAKQTVQAAEQIPSWTAPGPSVPASAAKGKSVLLIPLTSAVSFCNQLDDTTQAVAQKLGMKVSVYPTTGSPTQWAAGIEQGIEQHVSAIVLECSIDPSLLEPQLAKAKQAGVPVFDTVLNDESQPVPASLTGVTSAQYYAGLQDEALSAIANQNGGAVHSLLLTTDDIITARGDATAYQNEIKTRCGTACTVMSVNIPLAQWAQQVQRTVASTLTAHPDINTIAIEYDGMVPLVIPALIKYPQVGIYAYGGGEDVVKLMTSTPQLKMDVGEGADRQSYTVMDEILRSLTHQSVPNESVPVRVFTAANAAQSADANNGYGTAYVDGLAKLWGLGS